MSYNKSHVIMIKCKWDTLNSDAAMRSKYFGGGASQPEEQLAPKRQVAGMSHQGPAHAPSCIISAVRGKAATGGSRSSSRSTSKNKNKENKTKAQHQHRPLPEPKVKKAQEASPGLSAVLGSTLVFITSGVHTHLIRG